MYALHQALAGASRDPDRTCPSVGAAGMPWRRLARIPVMRA
ncbi:hypothetical protein I552_8975 [Mycobacterium xenopi 3993]|nr:hypothetical protein I552_8975 [Mycobacterium xenopi 3993]